MPAVTLHTATPTRPVCGGRCRARTGRRSPVVGVHQVGGDQHVWGVAPAFTGEPARVRCPGCRHRLPRSGPRRRAFPHL